MVAIGSVIGGVILLEGYTITMAFLEMVKCLWLPFEAEWPLFGWSGTISLAIAYLARMDAQAVLQWRGYEKMWSYTSRPAADDP